MYVTDTRTTPSSIHKYTADGVPVAIWAHIRANGGLSGLAVDPSGEVYVVDDVNNTIDVFRSMTVAPPVATISWLSHTTLNVTDTFQAVGMGQESVKGKDHTIVAYHWTLDGATVIGTESTLTKLASSFTPGSHSLSFEVQDSAGEWSASVSKSFYVGKLVGTTPWTMLLYLDGDYHDSKLLDQFTATLTDMRQHVANPAVRIAVLLDGPANGDTRRIVIAPPSSSGGPPLFTETAVGELAMDDPNTLANFIRWGQQQFPAQHYYLSIADHGQAIQGIGWDSTSDRNDGAYLTVKELGEALRSSGVAPIDVLHLDACSLNLLDVAYEVRDNVKMLVASQYLGWSYFAYADYAAAIGQATTAQDAARTVVEHYAALAGADHFPYTLSALDLERSTTTLNAVDTLAAKLAAEINNNRSRQATMDAIRKTSQTFDSNGDFQNNEQDMYVDLVDWARRVQSEVDNPAVKARAAALLAELNGPQPFIIANKQGSGYLPAQYEGGPYIDLSGANGLSIFYPQQQDTAAFDSYVHDRLFSFSAASRWKDFLQAGVGVLPAPGPPLEPLPGPLPALTPNHQVFLPLVVHLR